MSERHSAYRGRFLAALAAGAAWLASPSAPASIRDHYAGLRSDEYLGDVQVLAQVVDTEVFTEGPAAAADGSLYFTNIPVSKILRFLPESRQLEVVHSDSGKANGLLFDRQGRLLACEGGRGVVSRTDLRTGQRKILADQYEGRPLAAPNDLCQDRQGRIYFTSRTAVRDPAGENPKAVYRIDPDGTLHRLLAWPDVHMPNGIVLAPDERTLYLIEAHPDAEHHRDIRAYPLNGDGSLGAGRVLVDLYPGRSGDGMAIDAGGNLYVAAGLHRERGTSETLDTRPGIHVFSPRGELLAYRETPADTITNCTFGGRGRRMLYVTCGTLLLGIPTQIAGPAR